MKNVIYFIKQIPIAVCAVLYALFRIFRPFLRVMHYFLMKLLSPMLFLIGLATGNLGFPPLPESFWWDEIETKDVE